MLVANPGDHRLRKRLALRTAAALLVERVGDLRVGLLRRQRSNLLHEFFRIPQPIGDGKRSVYSDVFAGTSLPANVEQDLSRLGAAVRP